MLQIAFPCAGVFTSVTAEVSISFSIGGAADAIISG